MRQLLESAFAKVERAEETVRVLNIELDEFLASSSNPYQVVGELRNLGTEYTFSVAGQLAIPVRYGVLAGEIFYQLRTALDHALAAIVIGNGLSPTDRHQFPICTTPAKFLEAERRGDLEGVPANARDLIERLQPYQADHPAPSPLNLLREWNNADKHRLLVVVAGAAALGESITIQEADKDFSIVGMTPPRVKKVTPQGVDAFTIFLGEPHSRFRASAEFTPRIAIELPGPLECATVYEVTEKLAAYVRYVLGLFAAELDGAGP